MKHERYILSFNQERMNKMKESNGKNNNNNNNVKLLTIFAFR